MDHDHCQSCCLVSCRVVAEDGCRVEECPNECGAALHGCKTEEHTHNTCPEAVVPCINAYYGCKERLRRKYLGLHLEHCPASVLVCRFAHERQASVDIPSHAPPEALAEEEEPLYLSELWCSGDTSVAHASAEQGVAHVTGADSTASAVPARYNLSLKCRPVFHCRTSPLHPRRKCCIHHPIPPRDGRLDCTFPCGEIVRRDEQAAHYKTLHHDIHAHLWHLTQTCPMSSVTGCPHRQTRLLPHPKDSTLRYDKENALFLLKLPEVVNSSAEAQMTSQYVAEIQKKKELALYGYSDEEEESYDVLGQLPPEVLDKVCSHLDSLSLWYLSQVNHYLRSVCLLVSRKRGIVYQRWHFDESSQSWTQGPNVSLQTTIQ